MRVGLIQQSFLGSKEETIQKTVDLIKEAKLGGTDLVVLQELHQDFYFCISEDVEHFKKADSIDEDIEFWSSVAKRVDIVVVTTLFEKRAAGLYHNTSFVFERDGTIAGKYRKMHIPDDPGFYEKFYFTPGDLGFEPIDTSVGRLGVLICWDQWFPEAARLMALRGADILIYPTAIGWFDSDPIDEKSRQLEAWKAVQRGHAVANALPVVTVNRVGLEQDDLLKSKGIRFWGNSFVYDAGGREIFCADDISTALYLVDIDMESSKNIRDIWPFLRDRRIEEYKNITKRYID
jgi:N-carbamoylputrescine amidase